jgi:putative phage-type endonuclease
MDAETKARRKQYITGTDIAAIIGVSPWKTPLDVFMDKKGLSPETPDKEIFYWGRACEPIIADRYARDHNVELVEPGFLVHPEHDWWAGIPDRAVKGQPLGLEIKTAGWRARDKWGTPGTDEIPDYYHTQGAWYIPLLGAEAMDFPVLFSGQEYAEYTIRRDLELEGLLMEAAERFIRDALDKNIAPEMREPVSADRYIRARFPQNTRPLVQADPELTKVIAELRDARSALAIAEKREALLTAKVKAAIGDADGVASELGNLTWKTAKGRASLDAKALERDHPELIKQYTRVGSGSRRFVVPRDWSTDAKEED